MRVIGGKFKGKKIFFTNSQNTRPLRDFVRENIFNIIAHGKINKINLENSHILDLYSGYGSFGFECLSRKANKVVFVEKDKTALELLKKNVINLNVSDKSILISLDAKSYLQRIKLKNKFDLIFLDPPYKDNSYLETLKLIKDNQIFKRRHLVIIHRERKCEDELKKTIQVNLIKYYGRSQIIFGFF